MDIVYSNLETLFPCVFGSLNTNDGNPVKTHPPKDNGYPASDEEKESDVCDSKSSGYQNDDGCIKEETRVNNESKITDEAKTHERGIIVNPYENFANHLIYLTYVLIYLHIRESGFSMKFFEFHL